MTHSEVVGVPNKRFTPHKTLTDNWFYISLPTEDLVLGIKVVVSKVMKLLDASGQPIRDPSGNPLFEFASVNVARVLSKAEWDVTRKMDEGE